MAKAQGRKTPNHTELALQSDSRTACSQAHRTELKGCTAESSILHMLLAAPLLQSRSQANKVAGICKPHCQKLTCLTDHDSVTINGSIHFMEFPLALDSTPLL